MKPFDKAVVFCRAWDIEDYDPERKRIYELGIAATLAAGNNEPTIYPGSVIDRCEKCDIRVGVGPLQQAAIFKVGRETVNILCMLCAIEVMGEEAETGDVEVTVASLGNPFVRKSPGR